MKNKLGFITTAFLLIAGLAFAQTVNIQKNAANGNLTAGFNIGTQTVKLEKVQSSSFTAVSGDLYVITASATVIDPASPVNGDSYRVRVSTGTLTAPDGSTLANAGSTLIRTYNTGAWQSLVAPSNVQSIPRAPWPRDSANTLYAFGDSYTHGDNNGSQLPAANRYPNVMASAFGGAVTVNNYGLSGTALGWNFNANTTTQAYLVYSAFHSLGNLPTSWTGIGTMMAGFNDTPTGTTPSNLNDAFFNAFREGERAVIARFLIDGWSGVGINGIGNDGSTGTTIAGWATTGSMDQPANMTGVNYQVFNYREIPGSSPVRTRVQLNAGQTVSFNVVGKRAAALFFETSPNGGAYTISVNGTIVYTGNNLFNINTTTFGVFCYPQVVWLESLPDTASILITQTSVLASGGGKFLGVGWVNFAGSLVNKKTIVIGSLCNNTAGHLPAVLDRAATEIQSAVGSFTAIGYPVLFANTYTATSQADADAVDTNHLTIAGYAKLGEAFRNALPAPSGYSPMSINLGNTPKIFRSALHTSANASDIIASFREDSDSYDRIQVRADGIFLFGNGASAVSANMMLTNPGEIGFSGLRTTTLVSTSTISSGGVISSPGASGFSSTTYVANSRNPIWFFGNANGVGISYFQGTSGPGGSTDSFGFHFGTATSAGSSVNITNTGVIGNVTGNVTGNATTATTLATARTINGVSFNGSSNISIPFVGTTTNDNATAGNVGEYSSSLIASGSAVSLTTNTASNVTSISLTAGDWDVTGIVNFSDSSATVTATSAGINSTSATVPTDGSEAYSGVVMTLATGTNSVALTRKRFSLASTTTVYLVAKTTFTAGSASAFGNITARRVR